MGELSKLTGEFGENIVQGFLNLIGWKRPITNIDINCAYPEKHRSDSASRNRSTHGIDFVVNQIDSLLEPDTQDTIVISAKYRQYGRDNQAETRKYVEELLQGIECITEDENIGNQRINQSIRKVEYAGVLFYLSPTEEIDRDIITELKEFRAIEVPNYPVYIVDNNRISFIIRVLDFSHRKFGKEKVQFFYINTGFNYVDYENSGYSMPLQYINSSVLPLKVINGSEEILILAMIEKFDESTLRGDVGRAQTLTHGWGNKIIIAYPDYQARKHQAIVQSVLQNFKDENFAEKVSVSSFDWNFRSMEVED
ncbi:hypothetical protein MKY75_05515 [Paenibacillus sp. FSL L8-0663]|uniref:GapS4a family protein n=1 Tax=Paenibacillus sp. FSL L8-0663 TaxID=2921606 RepID=UPI0030FC05F9